MTENNEISINENNSQLETDNESSYEENDSLSSVEEDDSSDHTSEDGSSEPHRKKDIPDWAKENPAAWGASRARQAKKEAQREYEQKLKEELERAEQKWKESQASSTVEQNEQINLGENEVLDPETGLILDVNTPAGFSLYQKQDLENRRNQQRDINDLQTFKKMQKQWLDNQDSVIQSLSKKVHDKYGEEGEEISSIGHVLKNSKNAPASIIDFVHNMPDNDQADFLHYLSLNPKEWDRINALNKVSANKELFRHLGNYKSKNIVSNAPPPSGSGGISTNYSSAASSNLKKIEMEMRKRYSQKL